MPESGWAQLQIISLRGVLEQTTNALCVKSGPMYYVGSLNPKSSQKYTQVFLYMMRPHSEKVGEGVGWTLPST